jgi:hypothetical protein
VNQIEYNYKRDDNKKFRLKNSSEEKRGNFKKFLLYSKSFLPFFLSHHPECESFKEHTINLGRVKLCIGCFVSYPTAIFAFFLIRILNLHFLFSTQPFFILSLIFLGTFFLSPLNLTKYKKIKIIQKFLIGIGVAIMFNWIMERPYSYFINIRTAFIVFYILLTLLNIYHAYGILGSCYKCETPFNWGMCLGFCTIRKRMEKNNLDNFLLKFESFSHRLLERRIKKKKNISQSTIT